MHSADNFYDDVEDIYDDFVQNLFMKKKVFVANKWLEETYHVSLHCPLK